MYSSISLVLCLHICTYWFNYNGITIDGFYSSYVNTYNLKYIKVWYEWWEDSNVKKITEWDFLCSFCNAIMIYTGYALLSIIVNMELQYTSVSDKPVKFKFELFSGAVGIKQYLSCVVTIRDRPLYAVLMLMHSYRTHHIL